MIATPQPIEEQITQLNLDAPVGPLCPPRRHAVEAKDRLADLVDIGADVEAQVVQVLAEELALAREDMRDELLRRLEAFHANLTMRDLQDYHQSPRGGDGILSRFWRRLALHHTREDGPGGDEDRGDGQHGAAA